MLTVDLAAAAVVVARRAADGDTRACLFAALTWTASFFASHPSRRYTRSTWRRALSGVPSPAGRPADRREAVRPLAGYALFAVIASASPRCWVCRRAD
jgi:hypothetical protein